jgi:hypothetical protein
MTKYSCDIHTEDGWKSIALFSDKTSFEAMGAFIGAEFECGNSLSAPCDAIHVVDLTTGEIVLEAEVGDAEDSDPYDVEWDDHYWDDEPTDIDDDMGFDPYEGCFTYDC